MAHFDREVNAFEENTSVESDLSEEPSLCLDDSTDDSLYSEVNLFFWATNIVIYFTKK